MATRNFWIEVDIDGYKNKLKGGPRPKDGGMEIILKMRDKGEIIEAFRINCNAVGSDPDNPILDIEIFNHKGYRVSGLRRYR